MELPLLERILWAAGFLANVVLCTILAWQRRYRIVPWFSLWMLFGIFYTAVLFLSFTRAPNLYTAMYWTGAAVDLGLQIAVVTEIARQVFYKQGVWIEGSVTRLVSTGIVSFCISSLVAWQMQPAASSVLDAWSARLNLFITVFATLLCTSIMMVSKQLAMGWQRRVVRQVYGLAVWNLASFVIDTLHSYWRMTQYYSLLDDIEKVVYVFVLLYWSVVFWQADVELPLLDCEKERELRRLREILEKSFEPFGGHAR